MYINVYIYMYTYMYYVYIYVFAQKEDDNLPLAWWPLHIVAPVT